MQKILYYLSIVMLSTSCALADGKLSEVQNAEDINNKAANSHVIVMLYGSHCHFCHEAEPKVAELSGKYPDVTFIKVEASKVSNELPTRGVPTFFVIEKGKKVNELDKSQGIIGGNIPVIEGHANRLSSQKPSNEEAKTPRTEKKATPKTNELQQVESAQEINNAAAQKPVIVMLYGSHCHFCHEAEPRVVELSQKYPEVTFVKVDSGKVRDELPVKGVPTFFIIEKGSTAKKADKSKSVIGGNIEAIEYHASKLAGKTPTMGAPMMQEEIPADEAMPAQKKMKKSKKMKAKSEEVKETKPMPRKRGRVANKEVVEEKSCGCKGH